MSLPFRHELKESHLLSQNLADALSTQVLPCASTNRAEYYLRMPLLKTSSDKSSTARAFAVKMSTLVPVRRVLMFVRLVYRWDDGSSRAALLA